MPDHVSTSADAEGGDADPRPVRRGDPLGHLLAWISLGGFVSHFLFRRELDPPRVISSRPATPAAGPPAIPSTRSSSPDTSPSLTGVGPAGSDGNRDNVETGFRWGICLVTCALVVLTMYSRVYLGYHTVGQAFAGATLRILLNGIWFCLVDRAIQGCFPAIEDSVIGRMFYLKDTSHIPNVLKFEYDNARPAKKSMKSKSG